MTGIDSGVEMAGMHHEDMARAFGVIAETGQPVPSVDIARAIAEGRRSIRVRRTLFVAATAAVAALGVFGATAGVAGIGPAGDAGRGRSVAAGTASVATALARFDPMSQYATFGWLPAGEVALNLDVTPEALELRAMIDDATEIRLCVVTSGHGLAAKEPRGRGCAVTATATTAASFTSDKPIDGRRAGWVTKTWKDGQATGATATLQWEHAPKAFAEVSVLRGAGSDPKALVRRAAEQVRFEVDTPVKLPFQAASLPDGLRPASVVAERYGRDAAGPPTAAWFAMVTYSRTDATERMADPLMISASPPPAGMPKVASEPPGTVVNGLTVTIDGTEPDGSTSGSASNDKIALKLLLDPTVSRQSSVVELVRGLTVDPDPASWR